MFATPKSCKIRNQTALNKVAEKAAADQAWSEKDAAEKLGVCGL